MRVLALVLFLALPFSASAGFVPPDETKALFRRDLLPVDTDTMRVLSAQLTELARRKNNDDPAQLRATAQLLAVASRLDPVNQRAREIGRRLAEGQPFNPADQGTLRRAKAETWHLIDWFLHEQAGAEGNRLGHQLVDALHIIDPKHPSAARHQPAGERARWEGVVAPLKAFQPPGAVAPDKGEDGSTKPPPPKDPDPPEDVSQDAPPVLLRNATLQAPLLVGDSDEAAIVPVSLDIKENDLAVRFEFDLGPGLKSTDQGEASLPSRIGARARSALLAQWKALPPKNTAVVRTGKERYSPRNGTALAGPTALLIHAALAGNTLREDLVFIGAPKADGTLVSPANTWELLSALRRGPGGRLLVPPDVIGHLRAMLALGEPGFFVKYEVLAVSSLETALLLGSVEENPEGLIEAGSQFQEFRRIAASKPVAELAANPHARTRLTTIRDAAPYHLSARMLLLQGSGKRPTRLELPTLQAELVRCLQPMSTVLRIEATKLTAPAIEKAFAECRKRLDPLTGFVDVRHRNLRDEAVGLANTLHTLARLRQQGGETASFTELHIQVRANHSGFLKRLGASPEK